MKTFQAPATLTRVSFMKDGGLSLGFATQELSAEDKLKAAEYHNAFGYILFKENQFSEDEIPEDDAPHEHEHGTRSPSQRLRAVLYVLWQQWGAKADFETFYRKQINDAIERVKKLLD